MILSNIYSFFRAGLVLAKTLCLAAGALPEQLSWTNFPSVNESFAEELVTCLSNSWDCELFQQFLSSEIHYLRRLHPHGTIESLLPSISDDSSNTSKSKRPPNYYVGPYSISQAGGQASIDHNHNIFTKYYNNSFPIGEFFSQTNCCFRNIWLDLLVVGTVK